MGKITIFVAESFIIDVHDMMLKRKIFALMVSVAMCMLLGLSVVPHHHHEGVICVMHHAAHDGDHRDSDKAHGGDAASHHDDSTCVEHCTYLFSRMEQVMPMLWIHALCVWIGNGVLLQVACNGCVSNVFYERSPRCCVGVHGIWGLRAPPSVEA